VVSALLVYNIAKHATYVSRMSTCHRHLMAERASG
jgi:hypothetical protein